MIRQRILTFMIISLAMSALAPSNSFAGPNENTALILHAVVGFGPCEIPDPCTLGPQVEILRPGELHTIYVIARNYDNIGGLIFTATWDPGFAVIFATDCIPGCLDCIMVGQNQLSWYVPFADCQVGGQSLVVGRIHAMPTLGCLAVSQLEFPETIAFSCKGEPDTIQEQNMGRVCVGPGGVSTCNGPVSVQPRTWGAIKSQYDDQP